MQGADHEQRWVERDAAAAHNALYGESYAPVEQEPEDMHIGDDNSQKHYYMPPQQSQGSTAGTLAKLALGAGLLASGVGVPIGGYLIADALKKPEPAPAAPVIDTDTNTEYEVDLVP